MWTRGFSAFFPGISSIAKKTKKNLNVVHIINGKKTIRRKTIQEKQLRKKIQKEISHEQEQEKQEEI
jgi:hypothetical protein